MGEILHISSQRDVRLIFYWSLKNTDEPDSYGQQMTFHKIKETNEP